MLHRDRLARKIDGPVGVETRRWRSASGWPRPTRPGLGWSEGQPAEPNQVDVMHRRRQQEQLLHCLVRSWFSLGRAADRGLCGCAGIR